MSKTSETGESVVAGNKEIDTELQLEAAASDILLSLVNDITSIKDKREILSAIQPKLKKLFDSEDFFICRLDKNAGTINPFLRLAGNNRQGFAPYHAVLSGHFSIHDRFIDMILHSPEPVVTDIETIVHWPASSNYIAILLDSGIKESISAPLQFGGELLGVLTIWSDKKNAFKTRHKKLIQKVADQLSIVVAHIADNEKIRQKQMQNDVLLAVSHAIASIRDKQDLAQAMQRTLQSVLRFSDIAITRFDLARQTFKVFIESCEKTSQHPDFASIAYEEYPIADGIHDVIMRSNETVLLSVPQLRKDGFVHIAFLEAAGIRELAGIRLLHNNSVIGTMVLLSAEENAFSTEDLQLIKEVSHHFATAMVNIIYHNEIQERSREKEILLSISSAFSSIRAKEELQPILKQQLGILGFYSDVTITKVDSNKKTFSAFLVSDNPQRRKDPGYPAMKVAHHSYPDGVFERALTSKEPLLFDIEDIVRGKKAPAYIKFLNENGTKHMASVSLRDQNREIGVMFLFSPRKQEFSEMQLNLVQGIGNQLGTIVANILANDEILERENEKSILLAFSNDIAAVRNKEDLSRVIKTKLRELFHYRSFSIQLINEDRKTHSAYLYDLEQYIIQHEDFNQQISAKHRIQDGIYDSILNADDPVIFDVATMIPDPQWPPYVHFWKDLGLQKVIGSVLRVGQEDLGCLMIHLDDAALEIVDSKKNLLKGICAQLSIALSNILANDKIALQLEEISRYREQLEEEKLYLQQEVSSGYTHDDIIGAGPAMQKVFHLLSQVAFADSTVLITGETGTGKELIARAIHNSSPRRDKLMVKVNCAALPPNLIESELFGHEKGSFTGALEKRIGKFELADKGTLFLDEIGEMPGDLQVKLLRAIQEKEIERVGGKTTIRADVRIIAATNRNLQQEVAEGIFRSDLFYRLNVFPIQLPPLRDRMEDLPVLVNHFIDKYAKLTGRKVKNISGKAMKELMAYSWPGNIRELEHLIERSILMSDGSVIRNIHLPTSNRKEMAARMEEAYMKTHEQNERDHIIHVLNRCNGKIYGPGGAAAILNLRVSTLNSKIKKLGIKKNRSYN